MYILKNTNDTMIFSGDGKRRKKGHKKSDTDGVYSHKNQRAPYIPQAA